MVEDDGDGSEVKGEEEAVELRAAAALADAPAPAAAIRGNSRTRGLSPVDGRALVDAVASPPPTGTHACNWHTIKKNACSQLH